MPLSYKTRDRLFYILIALLAGANCVFAWFFVWAEHSRRADLAAQITNVLRSTRSRLEKPDAVPGVKVVDAYRQYQQSLLKDYASLADYFLKHDEKLERHILQGDRADEIRIVLNYTNPNPRSPGLKQRWAERVGNTDFVANWDWERPNGRLDRSQFAAVEKWCCVVDTVVDGLTAEGFVRVDRLLVGDPFVPKDLPPLPEVPWPVVRYTIRPVYVEFHAPFSKLSKILERFIQRPDDLPCTEIRRVDFTSGAAETQEEGPTTTIKDGVSVKLEIWVYDFDIHQKG